MAMPAIGIRYTASMTTFHLANEAKKQTNKWQMANGLQRHRDLKAGKLELYVKLACDQD
jgi:hypothetical protein